MYSPKSQISRWRTSSYSGTQENCVEVAFDPSAVAVRDSKDPAGPCLSFSRTDFRRFLDVVSAGQPSTHL